MIWLLAALLVAAAVVVVAWLDLRHPDTFGHPTDADYDDTTRGDY